MKHVECKEGIERPCTASRSFPAGVPARCVGEKQATLYAHQNAGPAPVNDESSDGVQYTYSFSFTVLTGIFTCGGKH